MEKLTKTRNWIWRDGEMSYADFGKMGRMGKDEHILFLSSLGEDELGTNDLYILKQYASHLVPIKKIKEFLTIEDEYLLPTEWVKVDETFLINKLTSTETSEDIVLPTEEELSGMGIEYLKEYLNEFFKNDNLNWEGDIKFSRTVEQFLENTKNYILIDDLTELHIKCFKSLIN